MIVTAQGSNRQPPRPGPMSRVVYSVAVLGLVAGLGGAAAYIVVPPEAQIDQAAGTGSSEVQQARETLAQTVITHVRRGDLTGNAAAKRLFVLGDSQIAGPLEVRERRTTEAGRQVDVQVPMMLRPTAMAQRALGGQERIEVDVTARLQERDDDLDVTNATIPTRDALDQFGVVQSGREALDELKGKMDSFLKNGKQKLSE